VTIDERAITPFVKYSRLLLPKIPPERLFDTTGVCSKRYDYLFLSDKETPQYTAHAFTNTQRKSFLAYNASTRKSGDISSLVLILYGVLPSGVGSDQGIWAMAGEGLSHLISSFKREKI
jgi:hypothetical protein